MPESDHHPNRRRVSLRARLFALAAVVPLLAVTGFSQEPAPDEAFERFRSGTLDVQTLAEVLPLLADSARRPQIRSGILEAKDPPRSALVALLDHPALAVRLGALELLEEMAGGDFSYNPWTPAQSPENLGPLARWKAWAGEKNDGARGGSLFSEDQRRGYLRDLLGDDADKAARARRMLEAEGLPAVGFLESFLSQTPTLPAGGRARVREAQYQIALARPLGDQAAVAARQLAFGSRDQLLSAIGTVRGAGMPAIPILVDFIGHPDPLVRETAIDSLLVSAGESAVPVIAPLLEKEQDVNVIHGALRRLKDIKSDETRKLVARFLTHPDEDLLVSAIQTSLTLSGDNDRFAFGNNKPKKTLEGDAAVINCLKDPRWRVRATALEYVAARKSADAKDAALGLLEDTDTFVRFAAIKAVVAIGAQEAMPKLKAMLMADAEMAGPVIEGHAAMNRMPDDEILAKLDTYPPEARLAAVRAAQSSDALRTLLLRYANDPDPDVACAALRAIASSEDRVKESRYASALVTALRLNRPEFTNAVLERLSLPTNRSGAGLDPRLLEALDQSAAAGPTVLDPLYAAFAAPGGGAKAAGKPAEAPPIPAAQAELVKELERYCTPETPAALRLSAAINLARTGHTGAIAMLAADLNALNTAQKIAACEALNSVTSAEVLPLLQTLLRDPVAEVRSAAAECALYNEKAKALLALVLAELTAENSPLQPWECYGYRFDYAVRESPAVFRSWCLKVLGGSNSSAPRLVLAAIAARHCANAGIIEALRTHTKSTNTQVRRAAWHALLTARPAELATAAPAIAADPEAFVRAVLPDRVTKPNYVWQHHFNDANVVRDNHSNYNQRKTRADEATRILLRRLAEADPSPLVRFESAFALIQQGVPVDFDAFVSLLPKLSKETNAAYRIGEWLEENAARATPALRPLLGVVDSSKINPAKLRILQSRISPGQPKGIVSFASLAEGAAATATAKDAPLLAAAADTDEEKARTSLDVVFFHKPGCAECNKTREYLDALKADFPLIKVTEHNILESSGLVLNQSLCAWFNAPSTRFSVAPAVFAQGGFVIGPDVSPATLGKLLADTMNEAQDDAWMTVTEPRKAEAAAAVEKNYETITLPIVLLGGLLDGINPCAFATIIFFLSYLQIARRTPREMLMVGAAFISAVFLAYLAAGLLLYQVLDSLIARFAGVQKWMNIVFGLLALVAAWLSLRDALRARAGRLDEMTLQLPGLLKDRIRGVIRSGARARRFVIAAFVSGLVISLLELACTGQVYAPIIYQIQKGRLDAVLWLVIYNLAFITPLVVIFLLAYGGLRSEALIAFQKKHTFAVKIGLALLFLGLAVVILFGSRFAG